MPTCSECGCDTMKYIGMRTDEIQVDNDNVVVNEVHMYECPVCGNTEEVS